eukprot:TRINITY_DN6851_c0_g1_i1.p1 TRINITY_DN6851_c0_g1~~TRINITY_DN6851_c0_g1_i1.p1  ORF type:complete len:132 (-),score=22.75 TRINITY_DN6851_c0_g1_i1:51-446(-)
MWVHNWRFRVPGLAPEVAKRWEVSKSAGKTDILYVHDIGMFLSVGMKCDMEEIKEQLGEVKTIWKEYGRDYRGPDAPRRLNTKVRNWKGLYNVPYHDKETYVARILNHRIHRLHTGPTKFRLEYLCSEDGL